MECTVQIAAGGHERRSKAGRSGGKKVAHALAHRTVAAAVAGTEGVDSRRAQQEWIQGGYGRCGFKAGTEGVDLRAGAEGVD